MSSDTPIQRRKKEHLELAASDEALARSDAGWSDVRLVPEALPAASRRDMDLSTDFLGHRLKAPLMIAGMTGGHEDATEINARLGRAAEACGIAIGVGSQRAALEEPALADTFAVMRKAAPTAFIAANIGITQVCVNPAKGDIDRLVDMVEANAIAVHLNILQELIQPEGEAGLTAPFQALARLVATSPVPVIVKETGCGLDRETALRLADAGVAALDVGGLGGTSFVRIERLRAASTGDGDGQRRGEVFADWGVPTALSVLEARQAGLPVIATGGVTDGLIATKALALGARLVGIGRHMLKAAMGGEDEAEAELARLVSDLELGLYLAGATRPDAIDPARVVLTGAVADWARQRRLA